MQEPDAVEADLQRFYGVNFCDYYTGKLSLRRLSVLLHHLPIDAATVRKATKLDPGWDTKAFLLADIFAAVTGKEHPARPSAEKQQKHDRAARLRRALEEQRKRVAKS